MMAHFLVVTRGYSELGEKQHQREVVCCGEVGEFILLTIVGDMMVTMSGNTSLPTSPEILK